MANDIIRLIQDLRKECNLQYTDHIHVSLVTADPELQVAIRESTERIKVETLAQQLDDRSQPNSAASAREIADKPLTIYIRVLS